MNIDDRKGFVKIGAGAGLVIIMAVLLLFFSSFTPIAVPTDLSGQVTGNMMEEALGDGNDGNDENAPVLIDFTRMGDGNGDDEGDDGTGDGSGEGGDDETGDTGGSGGFFVPMSSGGGGGSVECSVNCEPATHKECIDEECVVVQGTGDDLCVIDDDCVEECIPPYLAVDKTADPTELVCEETTITLTVSGEGEICDPHYPVDVVLVFDNSGSMDDDGLDINISDYQPIGDAKIAAKAFVDLLGSNDMAGLVSFNTVANLEHPLTFNKNNVKTAINGMSAGGWTNMSQGIDFGNQELLDNGRSQVNWIEILLSDGNNNCGTDNPPPDCHQKVFDSVQGAVDNGIVIYTIALGNTANQTMMQEIADMTGGKSYYAPNSSDLQEIYEEIAEDVTTIAASGVVVVDYLPAYAELNLSSLPVDCVYNDTMRKITCDIGEIHINETHEFEFSVYLYQLGYNLTNLYPESGVDYIDYNLTGQFLPFPETYVNVTAYDCDHTECNYDSQTCDLVLEPGADECQTFDDCVQHTECDYQAQECAIVQGPGSDECSDYDDCFHAECGDGYCIDVQGTGSDLCSSHQECRHHECNYDQFICEEIYAIGTDECSTFQDCPQHTECDYQAQECAIVEGPGTDQCSDYDDCFHAECGDGYCIDVQGIGSDLCSSDLECRHTECNHQAMTCDTIFSVGSSECATYVPDCGECDEDEDCDYFDHDYCYGDRIMHVEGICIEGGCIQGPPTEVEDCYYYDTQCSGDEVWEEIGFCEIDLVMCNNRTQFVEDCYYRTEYCDGDVRTYDEGFCNPSGVYCDDDIDNEIEDCYYYNKYCSGEFNVVEEWGSCSEVSPTQTNCVGGGGGYDCRDPYWCNGQEYCSEDGGVHCENGTQEDCSGNDISAVATCYFNPDNYGSTFDYRSAFLSACIEDGQNSGHCTTGNDTVSHACADDDDTDGIFYYGNSTRTCEAECDEDTDCPCPQDGCYGPDYYDYPVHGVCLNDCTCDVDETPCQGPCKPIITEDDPRCAHSECDYQAQECVLVEGPGTDQCSTFSDCVHTECCGMSCIVINSSGTNQCSSDADCTDHLCNYNTLTCDAVAGTGYSECSTFQDCPQHTECDYQQQACVIVEGSGTNECETSFEECVHTECNYLSRTCDLIEAPGQYECNDFFTDCMTHTECDYESEQCITVQGGGDSECSVFADCFHSECGDGYCADVQGVGADLCSSDLECRHHECNYDQFICEEIYAIGTDECSTFQDCPQHTVCDYQAQECAVVEGPGIDQCSDYDDCFHSECSDGYCIDVQGVGADLCSSDLECRHTECNHQAMTCDTIFSVGSDQCTTYIPDCGECEDDEDCEDHDYCEGTKRMHVEEVCIEGGCVEEPPTEIEDCSDNNFNMCKNAYVKRYHTETCEENTDGTTECDPHNKLIDCRDPYWCNGQEYCVNGGGNPYCADGTDIDCGDNDLPEIDTCSNVPDSKPYTLDYANPFISACIEDGQNSGHCTTGTQTLTHTCNVDRCDAECDSNDDCPASTCSIRYDDFCADQESHMLVEFDNDKILDYTIVSDSAENTCTGIQGGCSCTDNPVSCPSPPTNSYCVEGICGAECDSNDDCTNGCGDQRCANDGTTLISYTGSGECVDCVCTGCEETSSVCDPICMEDCQVYAKAVHHMGDDEIYIKVTSNGECSGKRVKVRYWDCRCPGKNVDQEAIEATKDDWAPKYDRLCTADAAYHDGTNPTHSMECSPCTIENIDVLFPQDEGREFETGVGSVEGSFQIDIRNPFDCYDIIYPVALACAGSGEDTA